LIDRLKYERYAFDEIDVPANYERIRNPIERNATERFS
jgi:hypothetical protein